VSDDRYNRPPRDAYDTRDRRDRPRDDRDRRERHRDDRYDDMFDTRRGSRRDPRDDRDKRDRRRDDKEVGKPGQPEWQRQALGMFKTYAMPIIAKEGKKYIAKQMGGLGGSGGGGGSRR
jgi:hypothetical protein